MHHVEFAAALGQQPGGAQGERPRFGEAGGPRRQQLQHVDTVADLAWPGNTERVGFAVQIKAGHLGEPHPRIEQLGVGLAGEDLDVVAEFDKPAAEVADVDPLPAAVRLAAVGQHRDAH